MKSLEEMRFVLNKWQLFFFQNLLKNESSIPMNRLVGELSWPTSCNGKVVRHIVPFKMSNLHYN
jgi:hypothetical protein